MPLIKHSQPFEKAAEINVGDVVWIKAFYGDPLDKEFIGPFHVIDIRAKNISTATLYTLFDSFEKTQIQVKLHDIFVPIIEKIDPPRGHNA